MICHVAGIQNTMFLQYINSDEEHSKFKLLRNYYYDILYDDDDENEIIGFSGFQYKF